MYSNCAQHNISALPYLTTQIGRPVGLDSSAAAATAAELSPNVKFRLTTLQTM